MTEREALIAMNMVPGMGAITARNMAAQLGSLAAAFQASPNELAAIPGIGRERAKQLHAGFREAMFGREIEHAAQLHVQLVTWVDKEYPAILKQIADPPLVLYVTGHVNALSQPAVAIVGTRRPSIYGRESARRLGFQLAGAGYTIVSGLAVGIDTEAHTGALQAKGRTVAVLGGALDQLYPRENRQLARDITKREGAVVTEYPFGRQPDRQTFPMRNRIVSGLSKGVLVVEATLTSGTMITAGQALDQGRSVMAVPGRIDSPGAQGCHKLLRDGATIITSADDVIEELSDLFTSVSRERAPAVDQPPVASPQAVLSQEESAIMRFVEVEGVHVDELIRATGIDAGRLSAMLIGLQLKRQIKMLPGNMVVRRTP